VVVLLSRESRRLNWKQLVAKHGVVMRDATRGVRHTRNNYMAGNGHWNSKGFCLSSGEDREGVLCSVWSMDRCGSFALRNIWHSAIY
jgi:hypothetical protein